MEAKELKIQIPEGYEIDKENSTFECIKFKLIKNYITYKDVSNYLVILKRSIIIQTHVEIFNSVKQQM